MLPKAIHQFHPSCSPGDGVTNGMLFTQRILRSMGFTSEIYCEHIPAELKDQVRHLKSLQVDDTAMLLVHHSLGYENDAWLYQSACAKALVYHNITPPELLPAEGPLRQLSVLGRKQLQDWRHLFSGAIGDSALNCEELAALEYPDVTEIPLLVDVQAIRLAPWDREALESLRGPTNILFVGRVCENKQQLALVEVMGELVRIASQPVRLILAGGITSGAYAEAITQRVRALGLDAVVHFSGKVSDSRLLALYRAADVYLSMSEHEGFGMPLIESMALDVPVLAFDAPGIQGTMGQGGLRFADANPASVAALVHMVMEEPTLRDTLLRGQRRNLEKYSLFSIQASLSSFLARRGLLRADAATITSPVPRLSHWQIQGPFDSSYSLAVVNRHVARSLDTGAVQVTLRSMEGGGDFAPSADFLAANSDCARMHAKARYSVEPPDVALRFCYPPHVDDMHAPTRLMHSYGWEETGFPYKYADAFNRKLSGLTVLSSFVKNVLINNGVRVPMAISGGGVDQLLSVTPRPPDTRALQLRGFVFLHVSSCFPRKGVDVLLQAYGQAFRDTDDVSLVIKTFPNPHNNVHEQLRHLREADPGFPHVAIVSADCSDAELAGWYQACHAFVAPSRGEGLGLPMAEAMLFRRPVITTDWGGQRDFCDTATAWLCDYRFRRADSHVGGGHSAWAEPDAGHLAALLRAVHQATPAQIAERTGPAYQRVTSEYTWAAVGQRITAAVAALARIPLLRVEPRVGWLSTWNKRCGIATYSHFLTCGFPADRLTIFADRHAELTAADGANVLRNWNMHHEETLDTLVVDIARTGVKVLVVQYNFGFFTTATLGTLIQRLKTSGVAVHCFFHTTADLVRDGRTVSLSSITPALQLAQRLYVHGIADLNRLKDFGLVDNVVLFPHGVMPPLAPLATNAQPGARRVIAAYGFLLPHKGLQPLIRAFAALRQNDPALHLLLLNALYPAPESAAELQACESLIRELGLGASITINTRFLSDAECVATLREADLIVYPYQQTQESASGAVFVGLAAGRPVAVTPLTIFDDVAPAVHTLPGTDAASLATGIRALLDDPGALQRQSDAASAWLASRQWPVLSTRLLNIIDALANPLPL